MRLTIPLVALTMVIGVVAKDASALERVSSQELVVDCSGCSTNQKKDAALDAPNTDVLYTDDTILTAKVDVTDFESGTIVRYSVSIVRAYGGSLNRSGIQVGVPVATEQQFAQAVSFVNAMPFYGPDEEGLVDPVPVDYPSAFELVGDQGHEEWNLSIAVNATNAPGPFGPIGEAMETMFQMLLDFLGQQDIVLIVEARDGTLIFLEAQIVLGDGETSVLWKIAEDGLRLADGNVIEDSIGSPGSG